MSQPEDRPGDPAGKGSGTSVRLLPLLTLAILALAATALAAGAVIDMDTVIDTPTEWSDAEYTITANITVAAGGSLTINGSDLIFDAPESMLVGFIVGPDGELVMEGVTTTASDAPFCISSDGTTTIVDSTLEGLYSSQDDEGFVGVVGGVVANAGTLTLKNVDITSTGVGVSAFDCALVVSGMTMDGGQYGLLMDGADADLADVTVTDMLMAFVIQDSEVTLAGANVERVNWTLWAVGSDVSISGMISRPSGDHLAFENSTSSVTDSYFYDGQEGAVALLGYMEISNCHFEETRTAIELLYAEGRIVDTLVEDCADMAIVLSFVGYAAEVPRFEFDNVTVRNGAEAGVDIDSSGNLLLSNLTLEGCGDGINVASSTVTLRDTLITGSSQCREWGCSYKATGTGILVETSGVDMYDVTIEGSNGPAVSAYFSYINATRSTFRDSNVSGLLLVSSVPILDECDVSGNGLWGIESLGYDIDLEELDATWGNTLADIRMNMTTNVKVVDQEGTWLSQAEVTAESGDVVMGPYISGIFGSTPTIELAIYEWTDGEGNLDFNPWTFGVVYGVFTNSTDVEMDMQLGIGQVTLVVEVLRADLVIEELRAPSEVDRDEKATIRATVGNVGNNSVESVILTFYYRDANGFQRVIGETRVGPMEPGGSDSGSITWTPDTRGDYTIVAVVDVDDRVEEEDNDNNRAERPMDVNGEGSEAPGPGALMVLAVLALSAMASVAARRSGRR